MRSSARASARLVSKSARRKARVRQRKQVGRASAIAAPPRPAQTGKRPAPTPTRRSPARRKPEPTRRANADALNAFLRPLGLTNVLAIARRDLTALFVSPIGWVVAGVFVFLVSAFGFIAPVLISQQATMDGVFGVITNFLMVIVIPLLTMRVLAERYMAEHAIPPPTALATHTRSGVTPNSSVAPPGPTVNPVFTSSKARSAPFA